MQLSQSFVTSRVTFLEPDYTYFSLSVCYNIIKKSFSERIKMKQNEKGYCIFYDWLDALRCLDRAVAADIIFAIGDYYTKGKDPTADFDGPVAAIVRMMLDQIKRAEATAAKKSTAGRLGGKASGRSRSKSKQNEATETETETETNTDTKTDTEAKATTEAEALNRAAPLCGGASARRKPEKFSVPTLSDVVSYVSEQRLDSTVPEDFFNFYSSKGWRIGSSPMADWKSALRMWNSRKSTERSSKPERAVKQRCADFDPDEAFALALKRTEMNFSALRNEK